MPKSSLHCVLSAFLIASASVLACATPALGDDHGHGPRVEVHDNGKYYKYEYKDRHCKYEYKFNYRTGEEKVKQKGHCHGVAPHRVVYYEPEPDWRPDDREQGPPPHGSTRRLVCRREVIGQVLGGVVGGVVGSRVGDGSGRQIATVAGVIAGVLIGGDIGRRMDRADAACAYQALEFAEGGETVYWRNPDSGLEYEITPQQLSRRADGRYCREYEATVVGAGVAERSLAGVSCRRSDGAWAMGPG